MKLQHVPDVDVPEPRNAELGRRAELLLAAAAELATRCTELRAL